MEDKTLKKMRYHKVPHSQYMNLVAAKKREPKIRRLALELWQLINQTK